MGNVTTKKNNKTSKEIEKFTKPTGLYKSCLWTEKVVRRMILEGSIAPRYPGCDSKFPNCQECPICFMYYPAGMNRSSCCKQLICTECFLQIKPPKQHVSCPFCNKNKYAAVFLGKVTAEDKYEEDSEEDNTSDIEESFTILASTQDRRRLQEESMRQSTEAALEQERIAQRRGCRGPNIENWYSVVNSSRDVARVEHLMIMEAIRRSMMQTENQLQSPNATSPRSASDTSPRTPCRGTVGTVGALGDRMPLSKENNPSLYVAMEMSNSPSSLDNAEPCHIIVPAPAPSSV